MNWVTVGKMVFCTSPQGNLTPKGKMCPQKVMLTKTKAGESRRERLV